MNNINHKPQWPPVKKKVEIKSPTLNIMTQQAAIQRNRTENKINNMKKIASEGL